MVGNLYPNHGQIAAYPATQRMLVTALGRRIGYKRAVKIGKPALAENTILQQAAERPNDARREDLDCWLVPATMTRPGARLPGGGD